MFKAIINDHEVEVVNVDYSLTLLVPYIELSDNRRFYLAGDSKSNVGISYGIEYYFSNKMETLSFYHNNREDMLSEMTEDSEFWTIILYLAGKLKEYTFKLAEGEDVDNIDALMYQLADASIDVYQLAYPCITADIFDKIMSDKDFDQFKLQ